jgi:hypothetical protein
VTDSVWVHPAVQEFADRIARDTGHATTVNRIAGSKWQIVADNGRARMTVDYRLAGRGRLVRAGTTLTIGGQPRTVETGYYHDFLRVFADPGCYGQAPTLFPELTPGDPAPAGVVVPDELAPGELRDVADQVRGKFPDATTIRFGRAGGGWIISIDGPGFQLRVNLCGGMPDTLRPARDFPLRPWQTRPVQLLLGGEDLTHLVQGDIDKALDLIRNGPRCPDNPTGPAGIGGERPAADTTNAVMVRKATVIRR